MIRKNLNLTFKYNGGLKMEGTAKGLVKQLAEMELLKKHYIEEELIRRSYVLDGTPGCSCGKALRKVFEKLCSP